MQRSNPIIFKINVDVNVLDDPDYFMNINLEDTDILNDKFSLILSVIQIIGVITSIITLMIIGVKYIFGSIEEKAEYKQTLIPWLVGAIFVFASTSLPKIIYSVVAKW